MRRGSEGGHMHVPARSTAGPARTAKWLVLKVGGGPGARCSRASSSPLSRLSLSGPVSVAEAAEIY